ncbi:hypothetical protein [Actinoplanes subglobosus]|uniref:Uncharacterized protein n=1 Tax=Actinoplanes subglobosus TaxID=1547892 RepID=A0ABV8ISZ8_9ACTN
MSAGVPVLAAATVTAPDGQARWAFPYVERVPYPTGVQVSCAVCVRAGVLLPRQGLPFRFADDPTPLCVPCWRSEEFRRRRAADEALLAEFWDGIGGVGVDQESGDLVLADEVPVCAVCGAGEPSPACWLCGFAWLREAEAAFVAEQAAAAAAVELEFGRIAAVAGAQQRVDELAGWVQRLQRIIGGFESQGRWGRAVELLMAALARDAAARVSALGRPSVAPLVAAVMAADSDVRSGRRSMAGRDRTAELVGCSTRAVSYAWRHWEGLGWATRTEQGRRLTLQERCELGRGNNRAVWDLAPAYREDPAAIIGFLPQALGALGDLLDRALTLLQAAYADLDEARAQADGWTDFPERVQRAQLRAAAGRALDATGLLQATALGLTICTPHPVSSGRSSSSCLIWGLANSGPVMIHSAECGCQEPPFGRSRVGASRSSTTGGPENLSESGQKGPSGSHRVSHHRTLEGQNARSRKRRAPEWAGWAYDLARDLIGRWTWLQDQRLPRVAATLGAKLGPHWDADRLVRHVERTQTRPVLTRPDKPLAYLAWLLDVVFTGNTEPPETARAHVQHRHQAVMDQAAAATAAHEQLREQFGLQAAAAAAERSGPRTGRTAAFAAAAAARGHRPATTTAAPAPAEPAAWSTPAEQPAAPGSGWLPGTDR